MSDPMTEGEKTGTPLWIPMREKLDGLLRDETSNTYVCGRVWHSWSVGTMSEDDFTKFDSGDRIEQLVYEIEEICEDRIQEEKAALAASLTDALKVAGEALQSVKEAWENPEMGWVATEKVESALAALERLKSKTV